MSESTQYYIVILYFVDKDNLNHRFHGTVVEDKQTGWLMLSELNFLKKKLAVNHAF